MVINRKGELILNYRKHHLYEVDHRWAKEGPNFVSLEMENNAGKKYKVRFICLNLIYSKACIAICMDINCYEFKDPNQFELAKFCQEQKIDVVYFLSA